MTYENLKNKLERLVGNGEYFLFIIKVTWWIVLLGA